MRGWFFVLLFCCGWFCAVAQVPPKQPFASPLVGIHYTERPVLELGMSRDRGFSRTSMQSGAYRATAYTQSLSVEVPYYTTEFDPLLLVAKYSIWFRKTSEKGAFKKRKTSRTDLITFGASALYFYDLTYQQPAVRPEIGFTWPRLNSLRKTWPQYRRFKLTYGYVFLVSEALFPLEIPRHTVSLVWFRERNSGKVNKR